MVIITDSLRIKTMMMMMMMNMVSLTDDKDIDDRRG